MSVAVELKTRDSHYNPSTGRFLSEDPIGFFGRDFNLYRYVKNNPVKYKDAYGLLRDNTDPDFQQGQEAISEFVMNYAEMIYEDNVGGDKFYHCRANCEATRKGGTGEAMATYISDLREQTDASRKGDSAAACAADQAANKYGRDNAKSQSQKSCTQICLDKYNVNGLSPYN